VSTDDAGVGVEVDVILTAQVPQPHWYVYRPRGATTLTRFARGLTGRDEAVRSPCLAYLLRHPSAGAILIDTGMHPDARAHLRRDFGGPMGTLFRNLRVADQPFDAQLRALGVEPAEVDRVLMTHLHVDHTSGMRLLPNALFTCTAAEWAATRPRFAAGKGYVRHHLPSESRMRLVDFDKTGEPYGAFSRTIDLLGDGSIRLVSTPGHTVGHMSVLLALADGRQLLVVGDAAYTLRNISEQILPMLTAGDRDSIRSLAEIKAFAEQTPEALIVPSHDPLAWQQLDRQPWRSPPEPPPRNPVRARGLQKLGLSPVRSPEPIPSAQSPHAKWWA